MMNQLEKTQNIDTTIEKETFFFERVNDKMIFATQGDEAWELIRGQGNWARKDIVYIGKSNAETYKKIIASSKVEKQEMEADKKQFEKELGKYIEMEDKLRFEDMIKEDLITKDKAVKTKIAKLKRVMVFIKEVEDKLEIINDKLKDFDKAIKDKAIKEEIKHIKKVVHGLDNRDVITPVKKDRVKIIKNLGEIL